MVAAFQKHIQCTGREEDEASISVLICDRIPVRGVKMLQVRVELHKWYKKYAEARGVVPLTTQKEFAFLRMESDWYEDKIAAILFMQEVLISKRQISASGIRRFEAMFRGRIRVYKVRSLCRKGSLLPRVA